jgi:peptidoglycan/LPS O-acetylase OafA/YrhL
MFDTTVPFLLTLLAYMAYSLWTKTDPRYLVGAALLLLVVTAMVDAAGDTGTANTLATFVFYLLGGGVVLLLLEHVREERASARSKNDPTEGTTPSPPTSSPSAPAPTPEAHADSP